MTDNEEFALLAQELILEEGRPITLLRTSDQLAPANADKPWKGAGIQGQPTPIAETVQTIGVFVVPATSIPTESRGLAFDWVSQDLLIQVRHVILVAAKDMPSLKYMNHYIDSNDGLTQAIIWGQLLQPGDTPILYCFGTKQ